MDDRSFRRAACAAVAICLCLTNPLAAQSPAPPAVDETAADAAIILPTIRVEAANPSLTVPSAAAAQADLDRIPGGVNFIPADEVLKGPAATVPQLFDQQPGIVVEPVFGGIDHPRFSIRGSGIQRNVPAGRGIDLLLDGLPITYSDGSFDFVDAIEPLFYDYTEVTRGSNGLRFGSTALGGAVNFVGRTGYSSDPVQGRFDAGSFDTYHGQLSSGQRIGETGADYYASGTYYDQGGFRQYNEQDAWRGYGNVGYRFGPNLESRMSSFGAHSDIELPGPQTLQQVEDGSTDAQPGNVRGKWRRETERFRIANQTTTVHGDGRWDLGFFYMNTDVDFRRRDIQLEQNNDFGARIEYRTALELLGQDSDLLVGLSPRAGVRDLPQYLNGGGTIPTFTGNRGLKWADNRLTATSVNLYAENQLSLTEDLTIVGGLQLSYDGRDIDERYPTRAGRPSSARDDHYWGASPQLGLRYQLAEDVQAFANVSRSYEPPTWDALLITVDGTGSGAALVNGPNPRRVQSVSLQPQTATTVEVGTRGSYDRFTWDLSLYRSWVEDEILTTTDPGTQQVTSAQNVPHTIHQGIELGLGARVAGDLLDGGDRLMLGGAYTLTDLSFDDDDTFGDNQLPVIPEHVIQASLTYQHPDGFYAGPRMTWVPTGTPVDYANTFDSNPYVTVDFRAGYRPVAGFAIFAEGLNLTDERYASSIIAATNNNRGTDSPSFAPGNPRSFVVGIDMRF